MWWFGRVRAQRRAQPLGAERDKQVNKERDRHSRRAGAELAADAQAFLLGRLAERTETEHRSIPAWEWTNLLAHGTEDDLRSEGTQAPSRCERADTEWRQARSYLAAEVLHCAELYGSLAEVQRAVLVPLELKLAACADVAEWKPGRWAATVEAALTHKHEVTWPS